MRAESFLQLYRILEESLETKYARTPRTTSSVVMEYAKDEDSLPFREKLNLCREIRNILTHNALDDGASVVEPSEGVVKTLEEIVDHVRRPLKALAFATSADAVMRAHMGYCALRLMREMAQKGFSHIPVYDEGRFKGVFSVSTVFSYASAYPGRAVDENTRVKEFKSFLPIDKHMTERFLFMDQETTYTDVKRAFEADVKKKKRVAVLFITEGGEPTGELLGLITPWDVLGKVQGEGTLIEGN